MDAPFQVHIINIHVDGGCGQEEEIDKGEVEVERVAVCSIDFFLWLTRIFLCFSAS